MGVRLFPGPVRIYASVVTQVAVQAPTDVLSKNNTGLVPAWSYGAVGTYDLNFPSALAGSINNILPQITLGQNAGQVACITATTSRVRVFTFNSAGAPTDVILKNCSFLIQILI